jgi:SAM-dependent methyltransferase
MNKNPSNLVHRSSFIVHRSNEAYGSFAYAYDQALGQRFFRAVRKLLAAILDRYPASERTHLDLACGTGLVSRFFAERGFQTTAVDLSLPMLSIARQRATSTVAADIRALPFRRTFGRITCLYDSLNHLQELDDLRASVNAAAACMSRQSLFIFDVNDPEIYPAVWGMDEPFLAEGEDFHLEIATTFRARTRVGHARVRGWARAGGGRVEIDERHEQRAWSREEIVRVLAGASLQPIEIVDFDPFHEGRRVKLLFVCRAEQAHAGPR